MLLICNQSLSEGIFPSQLKIAKITPVFKAGDRKIVSNYRPISILTALSKILEKIVVNQLNHYLLCNSILNPQQFGFRSGRSAENALQNILSSIYDAFSRNNLSLCVFLDLKKAFDTVNHSILLSKLQYYGIHGNAYAWFCDYFAGRKQFVVVNGVSSELLQVGCGVPQGSIVGPILFILYINDIVNCSSKLKLTIYADDTTLFYETNDLPNAIETLNIELSNISLWLYANQLTLNVSKTHHMIFHKPRANLPSDYPPLTICNSVVNRVMEVRCLGVILDPCLKFNLHIHSIVKKISKFIPIIFKIRDLLDRKCLRLIYYALVYPNIIYCASAWAGTFKNVLNPVHIVQKGIIRAIHGVARRTPSQRLFHELEIFQLPDVLRYVTATYVYRSLSNPDLHEFQMRNYFVNTRESGQGLLYLPNWVLDCCRFGVQYRGSDIYNKIPLDIRVTERYSVFKARLKRHILTSLIT